MKVVITVLSFAALVYKVHSQAVELVNTNLQFSSIYPNLPSFPDVSIAYPSQFLPPSYSVNLPPSVEIVQQNIDVFTSEPTIEVPLNPFPFLPRPCVPIPSFPSLPIPTVGFPPVAFPSLPVPSVSLPPLPIPTYPVVTPTVYQTTVEDNKVANSLANVLQLLVASKAIESSNKPNCPCNEIVPVCSPPIEVVTPIPSCVENIIAPFPPAFGFEVVNQIPLSGLYGTEYVSAFPGNTVVTSVLDRIQPLYTPGLLPGNVYLGPSSVPTLSFSAVY